MRDVTIARNYAEALFSLGEASGQTEQYTQLIDAVSAAFASLPSLKEALMSPRVPKAEKVRILSAGLARAPREFTLFVAAVVKRGRQGLLVEIAAEYLALLDIKHRRARAAVTLARTPDDALRASIEQALSTALGKQVIASYHIDPGILGGTIVRIGETVHDGSVRRRMTRLRRALLGR